MDHSKKDRAIDFDNKKIQEFSIEVDCIALLNIVKQASFDTGNRGWGKLLGYFDTENKILHVKQSYGLLLPKTDERMRKEDNIDEELRKNLNDFSNNFRQVGFYIFSEDNDIFTFPIINYIINNDKFGFVKSFMHFSIQKARADKNPFTFYEISDNLNKLLTLKKIDSEKSCYELEEDQMTTFSIKNHSLFKEIPFLVKRSPVFENFLSTHASIFDRNRSSFESERKKSGEITQNLNESIHKHAILLQNFIQNKKTQKKACVVNLFGSFERIKKTLEEKRVVVSEIDEKIKRIDEKLS